MKLFSGGMRLVVCLIGLVMAGVSFADDSVEVMSAEGSVTVAEAAGKAGSPVKPKSILPNKNVVNTGPNSRAVVRIGSDGFIVIGKNSQVEIDKSRDRAGFFRQITGMVYYAMNTIKGKQRPIEVRTASATIGIRGTRFLVTDADGRNEIGMRKGLINVASPDGEFEIHKKKEQDEFEAFKQEGQIAIDKQKQEFEAYKADTQKEFVEYKREFGLAANRMASFDGKRVVDRPLSEETKKDMGSFESYADEWLKNVND